MLLKIKSFLFDDQGAVEGKHTIDQLHVAAAALLLEAGMLDGDLGVAEREETARLIRKRFNLSEEDTALIMADAEKRATDAVDIHGFLKVLVANFDHQEQVELIEMIWDVVYADGIVHDYEANLIRRVTGMTSVSDRESGEARKRAQERAKISS